MTKIAARLQCFCIIIHKFPVSRCVLTVGMNKDVQYISFLSGEKLNSRTFTLQPFAAYVDLRSRYLCRSDPDKDS